MLSHISDWIILLVLIIILVLVIKAGVKLVNIIIMVIVLGFAWFSFFTDIGSARLSILLSGHPIIAYTTHLEKDNSVSTDSIIYFKSSKKINTKYAACNKLWIVRIPVVK